LPEYYHDSAKLLLNLWIFKINTIALSAPVNFALVPLAPAFWIISNFSLKM